MATPTPSKPTNSKAKQAAATIPQKPAADAAPMDIRRFHELVTTLEKMWDDAQLEDGGMMLADEGWIVPGAYTFPGTPHRELQTAVDNLAFEASDMIGHAARELTCARRDGVKLQACNRVASEILTADAPTKPASGGEGAAAGELTAAQFRAAIREALEGDTGDDIDLIGSLRYWFSEARAGDKCLESWQAFAKSAMALLPPCDGEGINPCETILNRLRQLAAPVELTPAGEKVVNGKPQRCEPVPGLMVWDSECDTGGIITSVHLNSPNPFCVFEDENGRENFQMIRDLTLPMAGGLAEQVAAAWREIYDVKTAVQK